MSVRDSIRNQKVTPFRILSILALIILAVVFAILAVILYLYDAEVSDAIRTAEEIKRQNRLTLERAEEQILQHNNITRQLSNQLAQHEAITESLSNQLSQHENMTMVLTEQADEHEILTGGLINVTDSNTVILEEVNQTVTDEDLEKSVSVRIDRLQESLDKLKELLEGNPYIA